MLSGGTHSPHPIQGIGAGFIPGVMRADLLDGIVQVAPPDALPYARRAAKEEGLLIGVSSGAALAAVAQTIPDMPDGSRMLTFNYDTGERYLSVELLVELSLDGPGRHPRTFGSRHPTTVPWRADAPRAEDAANRVPRASGVQGRRAEPHEGFVRDGRDRDSRPRRLGGPD